MREGAQAPIVTGFKDMVSEVTEEHEAVVASRQPKVVFSEKLVNMMHAVLSTVVQSRDLNALVRRHEHDEDGRAAYAHVLRVLQTELYGGSIRV